MDLLAFLNQKKKIVLAALFIFIIFALFIFLNGKKTLPSNETGKPQIVESSPTPISYLPKKPTDQNLPKANQVFPPAHVFATYENKTTLPTIPQTIKQYTFKTDFSLEEVQAIAFKLGLTELKESANNTAIFYNLDNSQYRGILTFNLTSGEFTFESYGDHKSSLINAPATATALSFLRSLGVIDETVACPITYQKQGLDGITFVECHRDWGKMGAPILSFVGVLNTAENKPLSSLAVGKTDESTPADGSIINTSTGEDGKARPNDFNTVTVAVSFEGNILFIKSNLRQIKKTTILSSNDLLTPSEALNQFMAKKASLTLSSPRGQGDVDLAKVYPQNQAMAQKAIISDYLFTYLEKPVKTQQEKLTPMYFIRGSAQLNSGYTVNFVETLPALKTDTSNVLGTQTAANIIALPTYPASANNPLGITRSDLSWRCLKSQVYEDGPIQPGGKTDHRVRLTGDGFSAGAKVHIVGCLTTEPPTNCTTGDSLLDNSLGLTKDPRHSFIVDGENPVTLLTSQTTLEKVVYSYSTGESATHSFYGVVIIDPNLVNQGKGDSVQYGTFQFKQDLSKCTAVRWAEPSPTQPPTPLPTQPPLITPTPKDCCIPSVSDLNPIYEVDGIKFGKNTKSPRKGDWYYIPPAGATEDIVKTDVEKIKQNIQSLAGETPKFRQMSYILQEFKGTKKADAQCPECPVRTTGSSPSLFVYGQKGTVLTIQPRIALTYSDPSILEAKMWSIDIKNNNILRVNNLNREYIYYEYQPLKFDRPKNGWIIEKSNLEKLALEIGAKLGLNAAEKQRLVVELKLAAADVPNDRLFIGLIPQNEIDKKLPLTITPQPNAVFRHHYHLTSAGKNEKSNPPKLSPLERKEFMVVELGAVAE
jgi:hypothetical protein